MSSEKKDTIQEKLKKYDVLYKQLAETGSVITRELNASLSENAEHFENFQKYTVELNSQLEDFVNKYEEARVQLEKVNTFKKEFAELAKRAVALEEQVSGFSMPDVGSLKTNLGTILLYLTKIQDAKVKAEEYLIGAEGGVANIANYFSSLQSELEAKLSVISKLSIGGLSKKSIESFSSELASLPEPKIKNESLKSELNEENLLKYITNSNNQRTQLRWIYREFGNDEKKVFELLEKIKDKVNFDKLNSIYLIREESDSKSADNQQVNEFNPNDPLESIVNTGQATPITKEQLLNYFVSEIVIEGFPGLSYKTVQTSHNSSNLDEVLAELKAENSIFGDNRSLRLSEKIFVQEKDKIELELSNNPKLNKKYLLEYIFSKGGSASTNELLSNLCINNRERALLRYELRAMKENNELIAQRAIVTLPNMPKSNDAIMNHESTNNQ